MKTNGTAIGILATIGISLTAAIALPLINLFKTLGPTEFMMVRGGVTAVLIAVMLTSHISRPSPRLIGFSLLFSLATLTLYAGIRAWGASPTLVVLTAMPIVNITAKRWRGGTIKASVYTCLAGLLIGVAVALNPWEAEFDLLGFLFSASATLLAGIGFEILGGREQVDPYNKTFWLASVTLIIGLVSTLPSGHLPFANEVWSVSRILMLAAFGFVGGFVYYFSYIMAFEKLEKEVASTLAMAETPAVIIGARLMLGEQMTMVQWLGVVIALVATAALGTTEAKAEKAAA